MRGKRGEPSRTGPIERDVLAQICRPLEFVAECIDGTDRHLPQVTSCPGPVSEPGGFISCGYFPGRLVGPVRALAQAFHFAGDLRSPLGAVGRDLERDARALDAPDLPAFREQRSHESRKSSDLAAENAGKHLRLALVGTLVDEETGAALGLSRPEIAFPSSHPDEAQTVEIGLRHGPPVIQNYWEPKKESLSA